MSFIIQGADLPKGYKALHMRVQSDGVVRYLIEGDDPVHIIDEARAIQIPKDHGKIVDITKYKKESAMQDDCEGCPSEGKCISVLYTRGAICEWLDNAPTILEAEE